MTNSSDERISALMDGELDEQTQHAAADELLKQDEARHTWGRYHLISDALRQNLPTGMDTRFSSRVMSALDDEPTVLAPPVTQPTPLARRLAGLAVAASVAAVAVMGVQFMYQQDGQAPMEQVATAPGTLSSSPSSTGKLSSNQAFAHAPIRQNVQTVTQSMKPVPISPRRAQQQSLTTTKRFHPNLHKYLIDHNQQTARAAVQGVMPYARIVAQPNSGYINTPTQK